MNQPIAPTPADGPQGEMFFIEPIHAGSRSGRIGTLAGAISLLACVFLALLLVLAHLNTIDLPGCGTASDCTRAAASRWGRLPGTDWPLSFVGFAYFQALAAAYVFGAGRLPAALRLIVAVGTLVSAMLAGVMFVQGYVCGYCLAIHGVNIVFAVGYEWRARQVHGGSAPGASNVGSLAVFIATFVAASALAALVDRQAKLATAERTQSRLQQALEQAADAGGDEYFAPGRYTLGLDSAPVHVVVVSDYQCPSCRTIDAQLAALVADRPDVSLSVRHFPFCTDCNPHIDQTRHANACRAALAAEAAGQVGGADAFWRMHDWLFSRSGAFTDEKLSEFVAELGLDAPAFQAAFLADATRELVRADIVAADAAGLKFTPMVFINGGPIDVGP
jgi:protein-disulfide isomerase